MQLYTTSGGLFASLSFVTNPRSVSVTNKTRSIARCNTYAGGINADSVFREAEELISELPANAPMPVAPNFASIRNTLIPLQQPPYEEPKADFGQRWNSNRVGERAIRQIIQSSFGRGNSHQQNEVFEQRAPTKKSVKHGPGRPVHMKIWMNIGTNDLLTRCKRARKFLEDGIPVAFKIEGQGQTANYMTHAKVIVNTAISVLGDVAKLGGGLQQHSNCLSQIFNPLKKVNKEELPPSAQSSTVSERSNTNQMKQTDNEEYRATEKSPPFLQNSLPTTDKEKMDCLDDGITDTPIELTGDAHDTYNSDPMEQKEITRNMTEPKPSRWKVKEYKEEPVKDDSGKGGDTAMDKATTVDSSGNNKALPSKFMTIDKTNEEKGLNKNVATTKNDEMMKRFLAMRAGNEVQANMPPPLPPVRPMVPSVIPPAPVMPPPLIPPVGLPPYSVAAQKVSPAIPYAPTNPGQQYGNSYNMRPSTSIYGRPPPQYSINPIQSKHIPMVTPNLPEPTTGNAVAPGTVRGDSKPQSGKSRWLVLDKD
ncbi:translation initiation factor IF-3, putative [Babesia ovis]|uniref:Translation initiation factor IF-3, putative n=1 Tax=Babesia ovis TaxID=5869 RepID=A0A9W5TAU2_BABOV|nr:translation initiation factor IF-3, putative [Babesia ovis]